MVGEGRGVHHRLRERVQAGALVDVVLGLIHGRGGSIGGCRGAVPVWSGTVTLAIPQPAMVDTAASAILLSTSS